jgi:hypothetical protein
MEPSHTPRAAVARRVRGTRLRGALPGTARGAGATRLRERARAQTRELPLVADELERLASACNVGTELLTEGRAELP